jgi:hypothetical protein
MMVVVFVFHNKDLLGSGGVTWCTYEEHIIACTAFPVSVKVDV